MNFLGHLYPPLAVMDILESTYQAVHGALGPPTVEETLAAEVTALRANLAEWQDHAGALQVRNEALQRENDALRAAIREEVLRDIGD